MNRIKNIRNRLSLSVDKLSPTRSRSPLTDRNSCHLVSAPLSVGNIPETVSQPPQRPKRDRSRASRASSHSRPPSLVGSPFVEITAKEPEITFMEPKSLSEPKTPRSAFVTASQSDSIASQNEFIASQSESIPSQCQSVTSKSESVTSESEFITSQSEPITSQSEFIASQSETISNHSDQITNQSESNSSQMKCITPRTDSLNQSFDSFQGFSKTLSQHEPQSLMEEVMKEVEKISTITESIVKKPELKKTYPNSLLDKKELKTITNTSNAQINSTNELRTICSSDKTLNINTATSSSSSLVQDKSQTSRLFDDSVIESAFTAPNTVSTLHAESLTSGYFSDSASEDIGQSESKKRQFRSKTASPIQKMFKLTKADKSVKNETKVTASVSSTENLEKKDEPKKESIYSRLIRSAKRDSSTTRPTKEPIYAKIKPKLKIETSFKPIEPIVSKEDSKEIKLLVKPEPVYSKVKSKSSSSSDQQITSSPIVYISSGNPSSSFTPISTISTALPIKTLSKEPIYSSIKPKKEKVRTLPLEALYSRIRKKDTHTLPKVSSPPQSKEPIYNQPLPALPFEFTNKNNIKKYEFLSSSGSDSSYGQVVTVKAKEITPVSPSKPSLITISNPGYAQTVLPNDSTSPVTTPPVSPTINPTPSSPVSTLTEDVSSNKSLTQSPVEDVKSSRQDSVISFETGSKETLDLSESTIEVDDTGTGISMNLGGSSKLSRLVEELAQELESVSLRSRSSKSADYYTKKEVLTKLLSTYDVPRNLRRVEEADESDIRMVENTLLTSAISGDELRYMDDDDNMETVYTDVPDYSQDEFVIALDDETDSKYASLTRGMRQRSRGGESPGKVSRKSAQVYVNVVNVISALKVLINSNSTKAATVINRMGTLARPYAQKVHTSISDQGTWIQRKIHPKSGHNGFDELRRYIKSGGEFCKELAIIMHERADLEATYAKGLHKLSTKLVKAARDSIGTVSEAWQAVGAELEHEGDIHRILAASLTEDVVRPLRQQIETQHKIRKGVESMVDKASKNLHDWKAAELKAKKNCYHNARENEKVQDMMIEARLGRGKNLSEKDICKLEKQRRKAEEAVLKSDVEYYNYCIRTERARQEWESAVYKGSNCFQTLEEDRLSSLKDLVFKYHRTNKEAAPKLVSCAGRLDDPVSACDVEKDIRAVIVAKGTGENIPHQFLPDFYSEDLNNAMNKARRREALEKFLNLLRADLDRERRGKRGVETLAKALQETPTFGGEDSQQDVSDKLQNMKAMLAYLEAARYKVQSSLDEINNRPRTSHPLAKHIETHRDKQGVPVSILKVPPWVRGNSTDVSPLSESPSNGSPNWNDDRGTADGNSVQPDSDFVGLSSLLRDGVVPPPSPPPPSSSPPTGVPPPPPAFMYPPRYPSLVLPADEFSSQGSDPEDYQLAYAAPSSSHFGTRDNRHQHPLPPTTGGNSAPPSNGSALTTPVPGQSQPGGGCAPPDGTYYARPIGASVGRCKALYDYDANMYDELSIRAGDIIRIDSKQPDGWWVGEVHGNVGIFPATYVEEID